MSSLLNENVTHAKYGRGMIVCEMENKIDIQFESNVGKKCFVFPDAFDKYLILDNSDLQKECMDKLKEKQSLDLKEQKEKRLLLEQKEQERIKQKIEQTKKKRKETVKKNERKLLKEVL